MSEHGQWSNLAGGTGFGADQERELTEFERGAREERTKWLWRGAVAVSLVVGWRSWGWIQLRTENHPGAVIAVAVLVAGGIAFALWRKYGGSWPMHKWFAPFANLAIATTF